jgi:formylglycine-generating enzyme required for sulfatase activity
MFMTKNSKIESFLDRCLECNTKNFLLKLSSRVPVSRNETEFVNKVSTIEKRISAIELQQSANLELISNKLDSLKSEVCKLLESNFYEMQRIVDTKQEADSSRIEIIDNKIPQDSQLSLVGQKIFVEPATGMEFVFVPGGTFEMGNVFGQGHPDERPTYIATLGDFWIGKYPVTQKQWVTLMKQNPSKFTDKENPVENVSWDDAVYFINSMQKLNNGFHGMTVRLPTEEEWEYAARSGGRYHIYSGGDDIDNVAWYSGNSNSSMPVGKKSPNELGIYDMSGNVQEWTSDAYNPNLYEMIKNNFKSNNINNYRISIRGGSWMHTSDYSRTMFRTYKDQHIKASCIGFRVVCG